LSGQELSLEKEGRTVQLKQRNSNSTCIGQGLDHDSSQPKMLRPNLPAGVIEGHYAICSCIE